MTRTSTLGLCFAAAVALVSSVSSSYAGPAYSCKKDRKVDVPMQVAVAVQGEGLLHASAFAGSDKSGYVAPSVWKLYDASGRLVDSFPKALVVFVSMNMLKETNIDGLVPGATYTVELTSTDWCNNPATTRQTVTMPAASGEAVAPEVSTPGTAMVGLQSGQFTQLQFTTTDNAGTSRVSVAINGTVIKQFAYENGTSVRWWFDNYPADNAQSVLEGPYYYVSVPSNFSGSYSYVEVTAEDVNGNQTVEGAWLGL